jgi:hypothetical protein
MEQRADKMCVLNKTFDTFSLKYKACIEQVKNLSPDFIVMQTCLNFKNKDKELKILNEERNQKQINEYLLKKIQC